MRSLISLSFLALAMAGQISRAQELPPAQVVELTLREVPTDPESPVRFRIFLDLIPIAQDGAAIGWEIDRIQFRKPREGEADAVWIHDLPFVPTADGLWWTDHVDPLTPAATEFVVVPWLMGTAESLDANYEELEFDFEGDEDPAPPSGTPFAATTRLSYSLRAAAAGEPPVDDSNDDEPVEMPAPSTDPSMQ